MSASPEEAQTHVMLETWGEEPNLASITWVSASPEEAQTHVMLKPSGQDLGRGAKPGQHNMDVNLT